MSSCTYLLLVLPKSIYRSRAGSHLYGTEYEIWADFGPVGNIEKKGRLLATFEDSFFKFSLAIFFYIYSVASALKSCIIPILFLFFEFWGAQNRLNIHNQLCLALLKTPPCATSI